MSGKEPVLDVKIRSAGLRPDCMDSDPASAIWFGKTLFDLRCYLIFVCFWGMMIIIIITSWS